MNSENVKVLLASFLLVFFSSCSKGPKCWGDHQNKGIIEESIRIDCQPISNSEEFIILDDSSFVNTFVDSLTLPNCSLPTIDFDEFSLLGLYTEGQCEIKLIRDVQSVDSENKYHYKVKVNSCGLCKKLAFSYNWVLVPKLPTNWTVTFEKEIK